MVNGTDTDVNTNIKDLITDKQVSAVVLLLIYQMNNNLT